MEFKIQWFPGHMTKARRMMETQLKLVDVVIEMLDARIPRSSSNPMLIDMLGNKPKVVALNKMDMADEEKTELWIKGLKNKSFSVVQVDCATGKGVKQLIAAAQMAARPISEKWAKKGVKNRSIRVMIVGVPNVGKSTLINRLVGRTKVVTENRPGVTRGQQWITIAKGLELLDTPGVLWPKFEDPQIGFDLAVTGAIKEEVFDRGIAVEILLEKLQKEYPAQICATYGIELSEADTVHDIETKIAVARGCLKAGGLLDFDKVIQLVLRDFKTGRMGSFTLNEPPRNL
jgi:ribosome biogenesis GTPase A